MVTQQFPALQRGRRSRVLVLAAAISTLGLALAGCSSGAATTASGQFGFPEAKQSTTGALTVWVDNTRVAAADAFKKAHPDVKLDVVTYDGSANGSNTFQTKMQLFDQAGSGWPDVVFSSQNNDASWASQSTNGKQAFAAVLNKSYLDNATISGFSTGALDPCTVDGKIFCLRNDLAQSVFFYNKTLLTQFGYTVPTTWEEYQTLGEKVAAEHPGYIVGSVGDSFTPEIYMWASKCQANDVTAARAITVNTTSTECKRMATLLDDLNSKKALSQDSVFTPEFLQKYEGKVLAMPGPVWYSGAIFNSKTALNVPAGQMAVAPPLKWGSDEAVTGNVGGGTWFVSSHSTNLANAKKFITYVTTSDEYQVDLAPGLPAFKSAGAKWVAQQEASGYFVGGLSAVTASSSLVWNGWGYPQFSQEAIWAKTVTPAVASGSTFSSLLPAWGTAIKNQAQVSGYKVK